MAFQLNVCALVVCSLIIIFLPSAAVPLGALKVIVPLAPVFT
jgi:hypothetical protein